MADIATLCEELGDFSNAPLADLEIQELACVVHAAQQQSNATSERLANGMDVFWLLVMATLVFFMQTGFAMLCAGSVRQKNVKNILFKNLLDACGGALGFWLLGYGFAYGEGPTFIGGSDFALKGLTTGYEYAFFFFQFAFAATAATIVAGTVAERCKMQAYLCYSLMLTGFVYPVIVRSIWSSYGFLSAFNPDSKFQMIDFAGSGVCHLTGGITALIAAIILGPRKGRFYDDDGNPLMEPATWPAHSTSLQMLGTFTLWFGWYGFNPGSALRISPDGYGEVAALAAVTTTISAASGAVSSVFTNTAIDYFQSGHCEYDLTFAMNGCLSGLVGITAGCSVVTPGMACIIGFIAGWVYIGCSKLLIKLRIDDAVDAIPVHYGNGIWGCIAAGLFANPEKVEIAYGNGSKGLFYGGGQLLAAEIVGTLFITAWVSAIMTPYFLMLKKLNMFRVDPLEEDVGLDISHHKGAAYDLKKADDKKVEELIEKRSVHGKADVSAHGKAVAVVSGDIKAVAVVSGDIKAEVSHGDAQA